MTGCNYETYILPLRTYTSDDFCRNFLHLRRPWRQILQNTLEIGTVPSCTTNGKWIQHRIPMRAKCLHQDRNRDNCKLWQLRKRRRNSCFPQLDNGYRWTYDHLHQRQTKQRHALSPLENGRLSRNIHNNLT